MVLSMATFNGVMTLLLIILFISIWVWAWSSRNKSKFDKMANLPLEEDSFEEDLVDGESQK